MQIFSKKNALNRKKKCKNGLFLQTNSVKDRDKLEIRSKPHADKAKNRQGEAVAISDTRATWALRKFGQLCLHLYRHGKDKAKTSLCYDKPLMKSR